MDDRQNMDVKEYIEKRMLEITNLKEREVFKQTVGDILSAVYDYNRKAYEELEERILGENSLDENSYAVYISMTDKKHYDETDTFLYPMRSQDTKEVKLSCEDIKDAMENGEQLKLYTVFLKGSASQIYQLLSQKERFFYGCIKTAKREYKATFCLKRNKDYLRMIEELYGVFGVNFKSWLTVCTAYLTKLLDVYIDTAETMQDNEEIDEIQVDFEEYSAQIEYEMIPLWNLRSLKEKTSTYPNPCIDKINYEHQFFSQRLRQDCGYLVRNTQMEITNVRRLNGDLYITCPIAWPCDWNLYEVHHGTGKEKYPYPVLSNQYKETFSGNITEMFRKSIKTRAEMARLIESFDYSDYIVFQDFSLCDDVPDECIACNYNMDGFIEDEIRTGKAGQVLVIYFVAKDHENYLNEDIMSFLVTQVQRIFPDYHCVGKMI